MSKKLLTIIGLLLVIAGTVIATCVGFTAAKLTGFAVTMFGAGLATADLWKSRKEGSKTWLNILAICFVGVGAFIAGVTGFVTESTVTTIIGCVISIVLVITGIITSVIANKKSEGKYDSKTA